MNRKLIAAVALAAAIAITATVPTVPTEANVTTPARPRQPGLLPPPNEPAQIAVTGDAVEIRYGGGVIFSGRIVNPDALARTTSAVVRSGRDAISQVVVFHAASSRIPIELKGTVATSVQGFPCESDRPLRGTPIVRHSSGPSASLRNRAVYDRRLDWVISADEQPPSRVRIVPTGESASGRAFTFEASGRELILRFRPRFYQKHRGLAFYEPWTYDVWAKPVVGWCSWFAYFDKVTEQDMKQTADVMAEELSAYGYEYVQMDDGYQQASGLPDLWLTPNRKFPGGLASLASYIKGKGLRPGIWTNAAFQQSDYAESHKDYFVLDPKGRVARGNWIEHPVDASNPAALDTLVRPIYRALRKMGWDYFKLDALRHLRYEGYNSFGGHFAAKGVDPNLALRRYVEAVRDEIGRDAFLLACWGIRPELIGLVDGCRIGTDGFSFAGLSQFNSFNNVVWRNDPDHIELSEQEAWRSTMVTSLTGSLFLLTDKPERYATTFVEPARRAAPVLVTVPGQLYDVDPSRSDQIWRVDTEVSGSGPRPFDAGLTPSVHLYLLEVNRPFESWIVLGRTGGALDEIAFEELGLNPAKRYIVFEFWTKQYRGDFSGSFAPGAIPPAFNSQVFVIREHVARPQVVATSRHITGGGVDLLDVEWAGDTLSARSQVVGGDPYEIYLTEPAGMALADFQCDGGTLLKSERTSAIVKVGCTAGRNGELRWRARYRPSDRAGHQPGR